jgi:transposase
MNKNDETTRSDTEISALKNRVKELEILVKFYEDQFSLSKKRQFGVSSEKSQYDQLRMVGMNEADDLNITPSGQEPDLETVKTHYRNKKRTRADSLPKDILVEKIVCELSREERTCPECSDEMSVIGNEYRDELVVIPAKTMIRRYEARTYACKACSDSSDQTPIRKAVWPKPVIKGSYASPESIAYTAHQKFAMGVPLYRQEQEWQRHDVLLSRQTMANWLIRSSKDWLAPIMDELKRRLLLNKVLHADETTFQVLKEPGKRPQSKSYLWCYRTSGDADEPIVLAEYRPDRKNYNPAVFLKGYSGYLHSDGYDAYHRLPAEIVVIGCWAHVRRKWDDALKIVKPEDRDGSAAWIGKRYCDKLFKLEREFASLNANWRYTHRLHRLKPVMNEFFEWADGIQDEIRPKSPAGAAISYMFSQQQYLRNVLLDGRLELSNNRAERSIKPFVISRKNFLFANTPRGAETAAVFFSLIETAKETGVNPYEYLTYVFKTAPNVDMSDPEKLSALIPSGYKKIQGA